MSLDVYLRVPNASGGPRRPTICIRADGQTQDISREEWDRCHPGCGPVTVDLNDGHTVFTGNITHNLGQMAREAGIYEAVWRPEERGITHARELIAPLHQGLARLVDDPARYHALNPQNGWGRYEWLVAFVQRYLTACEAYPQADVSVSR